jgi:hypothetical protein
MSTGADCQFQEVTPGRWSYQLQEWPYGDNPDYTTYGPFRSFRAAHEHLNENHANPGGYMAHPLPEGQHVHEFTPGAWVQRGVSLKIDVESLGPNPAKEDVIRLVQSLPVDHPAFKVFSSGQRFDESIKSCEACGAQQP